MFLFSLIIACNTTKPKESDSAAEIIGTAPMSALEFAEVCKRELGLPETPLPPMKCTEGAEIPITVHGQLVDDVMYDALANYEVGCDAPSWINSEEPCASYSFLNSYELSETVTAMLFCRKRNFSNHLNFSQRLEKYSETPSQANFEDLYFFDTVGLIWANHENGKSCFFDNQHPNFYAGVIPSPDDPNPLDLSDFPDPKPNAELLEELLLGNQNDIWRMPYYTKLHARCQRCHDGGPFIRSPHINDLDMVPPHKPWLPHKVILPDVGTSIVLAETKAISTTDVQTASGPQPQLCTSCHNIGSETTCDEFIDYYTGSLAPKQNTELSHHDLILMPPPSEDDMQLSESEYLEKWESEVRPHLDKLRCCCENPDSIGCRQRDLRDDNPNNYVLGPGPETCE